MYARRSGKFESAERLLGNRENDDQQKFSYSVAHVAFSSYPIGLI